MPTVRQVMAVAALLLASGACAPTLPPAAPTTERHLIRVTSSRCILERCRETVAVGREQFRVESRTRMLSAEERRSAGEIIGGAILEDLVILLGGLFSHRDVGLGTRTITRRDEPSLHLRCRFGWVQEATRRRVKGEVETSSWVITEGMDCEAVRTADSAVTWRFRAGTPPSADTLAIVEDTARRDRPPPVGSDPRPLGLDLRLHLERTDAAAAVAYGVTLDSAAAGGLQLPVSVWGVFRPDGTRLATLRWRYRAAPGALDIHPPANSEERRMLFLAAAALAPAPG
jgi:hypothetical protein